MVSLCPCKWIWIPLMVLSMLTTVIESEKKPDEVSRLSHRNRQRHPTVEENNLDLATNHIPLRKKRSSRINATSEEITTITAHVVSPGNKKTLLDLEKPAPFNDFDRSYEFEESSNENRVRVKRTDTNFDESDNLKSFMEFDGNYLDSFPRSSDERHWSFKKRRSALPTKLNDNDISNTFGRRNLTNIPEAISSYPNITEAKYCLDNSSRTSSSIDSTPNVDGLYKMRIKREKKSNKNRRRVLHGKKKKSKKYVGKGVKKKGTSSNRGGKRLSKSSKVASALKGERRVERAARNNLLNVIDEYRLQSRIEKRDSNDDKSQVEVAKRNVSLTDGEVLRKGTTKEEGAVIDEAQRDKRSLYGNAMIIPKSGGTSRFAVLNLKYERSRAKRNGSNDSSVVKYPNEPTPSSVSISSDNEIEVPAEGSRDNRAVKSIEAIKELAEKLVTKVNELQNYLSSDDQRGGKAKKKLESREIEVPRGNVTNIVGQEEEEEVVLEAPKLVDECVRIGDLSSALKNLEDRNVSLEESTSKIEVGTERISLSNDRTSPLAKRMVRKSRIKRKSRRKWGRWTGWSSCSVTCGKGRQIRWRHCLRDCSTVETEMEEKTCQLPACPPGKFLGIF